MQVRQAKGKGSKGGKAKRKPHDASAKQAKGKEDGFDKSSKNYMMQAYDMQRGKKTDAENQGKVGDARRKTKIGVRQHAQVSKHVSEAIKHRKRQAKSNRCFKTKFSQL